MKRNAKIKLVPAETIVPGQTYIGCLHGDTSVAKRSVVVVCDEQDFDMDDKSDEGCYTCRFENGNTYPYLKVELFKFVAEYEVPSLANPRKMVGTNTIDLDWSDYVWTVNNPIVDTPNRAEVVIDFDNNKAKLLILPKVFTVGEVVKILKEVKSLNEDSTSDFVIEEKIKQLKSIYLW